MMLQPPFGLARDAGRVMMLSEVQAALDEAGVPVRVTSVAGRAGYLRVSVDMDGADWHEVWCAADGRSWRTLLPQAVGAIARRHAH